MSDPNDSILVLASLEKLELRLTTKLDSVIDALSSHSARLSSVETAQKATQENAARFWSQTWPDMTNDAKKLEERVRILENQGAKFAAYAGFAAMAVSVGVTVALKLLHLS